MKKAVDTYCSIVTLIILLLSSSFSSKAQQRSDRLFKTYSTKEGLGTNSIYFIEKSKTGLLWISTPQGLHRFDGYGFENWNKTGGSTTTKDLRVFFTKEDSESNLWAFTLESSYIFRKNERVYRAVSHGNLDSSKMANLRPLFESRGRIWCFNHKFGLIGLSQTTLKADSVVNLSSSLSFIGDEFSPMLANSADDESGNTWVAGSSGDSNFILCIKKNLETTIRKFSVRDFGILKAFIPTIKDEFLFCSTTQTLLCKGVSIEHPIKILSKENIPGNYNRSFCFEKLKINNKGSIIFPGNEGIWEYNPSDKTLLPYSISFYATKPISRQLVFSIREDDNGIIWVGRDAADGLLAYYPSKLRFNLLEAPSQYFNLVYSMAVDENEYLYAANYEKGINVFDSNGRFHKHISLPFSENILPVSVRCMAVSNSNHLLLKTLYGKLLLLDLQTSKLLDISSLIPPYIKQDPLAFDANIVKTGRGTLLFFINKYLLEFIQTKTSFQLTLVDSISNPEPIKALAISNDGYYTVASGSNLYQKKNNSWSLLPFQVKGIVKQITYDKQDNLWIATSLGIHKIDKDQKIDRWYTQADGLANEFVYGILFDEEGNAWYSSNKGIGCIQSSGKVSTYSEDDGLQGEEFDTQSFCEGKSGRMYFGGVKAITSFLPTDILQQVDSGKVLLTGLSVNGVDYLPSKRTESFESIQLPYSENVLTFNFSLTEFTDPSSNVYQVKIENLDKDWSQIKNIHSLRYTLQPGEYVLKIKGSSDGSKWSEEYQLPITIQPGWWQTWPFQVGVLLFAVSGIAAIVVLYNRNRRKKLLEVQKELQKERERISRDLHDNIGAYTSSLLAHVDDLKRKIPELSNLDKNLGPIKDDANQILGSLRETIWILKNEKIALTDFSDGFKQYANKLFKNFDSRTIEYQEDIVHNPVLTPSQVLNLYRILQEALQNTIKHSKANKISFKISDQNQISISYNDNGIGFDPGDYSAGNGIENMTFRANEAGFKFQIESSKIEGTTILLTEK